MASALATRQGWVDDTIVHASDGSGDWTVQRHADGRLRCDCPSFRFAHAPKACKHTRAVVAGQKSPAEQEWLRVALDAVGITSTPAQRRALATRLAARPTAVDVPASWASLSVPVHGVRHITLED